MIPGNVCAVWYKSDKDMDAETADAARICKGVFEKIGADASEQYSIPTGVKEEVYCKKTDFWQENSVKKQVSDIIKKEHFQSCARNVDNIYTV